MARCGSRAAAALGHEVLCREQWRREDRVPVKYDRDGVLQPAARQARLFSRTRIGRARLETKGRAYDGRTQDLAFWRLVVQGRRDRIGHIVRVVERSAAAGSH